MKNERNDEPLRRAIDQLPEHEPLPESWARLAAELNFQDARADLPETEPAAGTWAALEARLSPPVRDARVPVLRPRRWVRWSAAASLVGVLFALTWWFTRPTETVSYRQEIAAVPVPLPPKPVAANAEVLIRQRCAERADVCRTPRFRELKREWDELAADRARLARQGQRFGPDPDLRQALHRIETVQAEVTNELLTLLTT